MAQWIDVMTKDDEEVEEEANLYAKGYKLGYQDGFNDYKMGLLENTIKPMERSHENGICECLAVRTDDLEFLILLTEEEMFDIEGLPEWNEKSKLLSALRLVKETFGNMRVVK